MTAACPPGQRIIRGIGNRASRGRLRADLSQLPDRPPRGMVICTGEDLPSGHSIQARLVIVEVDRERLNLAVVSDLQSNGHRLAHAMRGYIEWLLPMITPLRKAAPERVGAIRNELHRVGSHLRQAEALAPTFSRPPPAAASPPSCASRRSLGPLHPRPPQSPRPKRLRRPRR